MKRLLVIAAGYLQTFLIKKAKALGYHVIAIDGNPNAIGFRFADESACIDITDPEACIRYASSKHINGVVTAASDYGVISAGETAKALKLPGLNPEVARLIKNKFLVRKCLFQKRVDDTQQAYQVDETTDICKISKTLVFPVMVKPCDGSGSRGASRVDCRDELAPAIKYAIDGSLTHRAIIESFITGQEYGVESFVYDGEVHILGVMKNSSSLLCRTWTCNSLRLVNSLGGKSQELCNKRNQSAWSQLRICEHGFAHNSRLQGSHSRCRRPDGGKPHRLTHNSNGHRC